MDHDPQAEDSTWLRRRVARLLLRLDRQAFGQQFRLWYRGSAPPQLPELRAYDYFTRLLFLAESLLDEIVPRIRRQMSFQPVRASLREEPPLRGQIDWGASLAQAWAEHPGQPPVRFATRQRSRSFATPENYLLAAVLEHYARALAGTRTGHLFIDAPLTDVEQRELAAIESRVRRELAAMHMQEWADDGDDNDIAALLAAVEQRLPPGINPYRDLVEWWRHFEQLHLGDGAGQAAPVLDSRAHLNELYRLWVALELVAWLESRHLLTSVAVQDGQLTCAFQWQGRALRLVWETGGAPSLWQGLPDSGAGYLFTRAEPLAVLHEGCTIWREPGVLLAAMYSAPDAAAAPADAIRRALVGAQAREAAGVVLALPDLAGHAGWVRPTDGRYTGASAGTEARLFALRPQEPLEKLHTHIATLLEQVAAWLPERPPIVCHGTLQDADTVNAGALPARCCDRCGAVLAVCPKPHVGPAAVDLVCPRCDCLCSPVLCHILPAAPATVLPPFVRRVLTREQLIESIGHMRVRLRQSSTPDDESPEAEVLRAALLQTMGELTENYVSWKQPDAMLAQIEEKLSWAFGALWRAEEHARGLPEDVRHMLLSGEYVWNEFQQAGVQDWAACAVQYVRALERELHRRLYARCGTPSELVYYGMPMQPYQFTFGSLSRAFRKRHLAEPDPNWRVLVWYAAERSGADMAAFEALIADVTRLRKNRNKIAHSQRIGRSIAGTVRQAVLGSPGEAGVLRRFIDMLDAE